MQNESCIICRYAVRSRQLGGERCCSSGMSSGFLKEASTCRIVRPHRPASLLRKLKTFPTLNRLVKAWLQAGVLDNNVFTETTSGTPQGGVASPLLANIALHGLEAFIRSHFPTRTRRNSEHPGQQLHWQPQVIRYAHGTPVQA